MLDDIIQVDGTYFHPRLNYGVRIRTICQMEVVKRVEPRLFDRVDGLYKKASEAWPLRDVRHAKSPLQERGVFD